MIELRDFLSGVAARKTAIGLRENAADIEAMRNKGARRTPEKRELLRRAEKRAVAASREPVRAHY